VVPPYIVDFLCPAMNLVVEVDGDTHDAVADAKRDAALVNLGYRVLRVTNEDVMRNMDGVLTLISEALADGPHPNPSPEGEGLEEGISLEGNVG
jgi:very-short-patch-repair endonuclease